MKKVLAAIVVAVTVVGVSGCFPVFIPVNDHYYGHHHRDWDRR